VAATAAWVSNSRRFMGQVSSFYEQIKTNNRGSHPPLLN